MRSASWPILMMAAAAVAAVAPGCETDDETVSLDVAPPEFASDIGDSDTDAGPGAASPIEDYKYKVFADAMRGLDYSTGRVRVDPDSGRVVEGVGDRDRAFELYRGAEHYLYNENMLVWALDRYTRAVMIAPDEPVILEGLARALTAKGKRAEAEAAYLTALDLDPQFVDAWHNLGSLYYGFGEYQAGIDTWRRALRLDPNRAETHERLATANYYAGDYAAAERHMERAEASGGALPPQFKRLLAERAGGSDR